MLLMRFRTELLPLLVLKVSHDWAPESWAVCLTDLLQLRPSDSLCSCWIPNFVWTAAFTKVGYGGMDEDSRSRCTGDARNQHHHDMQPPDVQASHFGAKRACCLAVAQTAHRAPKQQKLCQSCRRKWALEKVQALVFTYGRGGACNEASSLSFLPGSAQPQKPKQRTAKTTAFL